MGSRRDVLSGVCWVRRVWRVWRVWRRTAGLQVTTISALRPVILLQKHGAELQPHLTPDCQADTPHQGSLHTPHPAPASHQGTLRGPWRTVQQVPKAEDGGEADCRGGGPAV